MPITALDPSMAPRTLQPSPGHCWVWEGWRMALREVAKDYDGPELFDDSNFIFDTGEALHISTYTGSMSIYHPITKRVYGRLEFENGLPVWATVCKKMAIWLAITLGKGQRSGEIRFGDRVLGWELDD